MPGVLIVTHGDLATALMSTLGMILGETEGLSAVSLMSKDSLETLQAKMEKALQKVDPQGKGSLVLVDMLGGTPFNCAMQLAASRKIRVLTGVNLPMLFKVVSHREESDLEKLTLEVQKASRESILTSMELMKKP